jgi:hypothetical protein
MTVSHATTISHHESELSLVFESREVMGSPQTVDPVEAKLESDSAKIVASDDALGHDASFTIGHFSKSDSFSVGDDAKHAVEVGCSLTLFDCIVDDNQC